MSRIVERLADCRPLVRQLVDNDPPGLRERYAGTNLIDCWLDDCGRAVIITGVDDIDSMLELVDDEGWVLLDRRWFCPDHRAGEHSGAGEPAHDHP